MNDYLEYLNESPTIFFKCKNEHGWPVEFVTQNVFDILGYKVETFTTSKMSFFDVVLEQDREHLMDELTKMPYIKEKSELQPYRMQNANGEIIWVQHIVKIIRNSHDEICYYFCYITDISTQIQREKQLQRYFKIIDENVLVSTTDGEGKIVSFSKKFKETSEFTKEELIGSRHNIMKHEDNEDYMYKDLWETITQGKKWVGEHKNISKNGRIFYVENVITPNFDEKDEIEGYTSIYTDITLQKEISELLITDGLTNIYNRRHFNTIFNQELHRSRRHHYNFVLMMIDIDFFKQYNDIYGHKKGDDTLISVAQKIKNSLHRAEDFAFRLGGEEFAVITTDMSEDGIIHLAEQIKNNIENLNIKHKGNELAGRLTISIGIANIQSNELLEYEDIYKRSDEALYKAKENGRNQIILSM